MNEANSKYSQSRYFTPPQIEPLNLDLVELSGGGACPAQYYGKTPDGLDVYCRYRGGNLSVTIANKPGVDCLDDGKDILDEVIGPPLSGVMSIGDFCRYAGITVNGKPPADPEIEREYQSIYGKCGDLSGDTTFYDVWLDTKRGRVRKFIDAIFLNFPDATLIKPVYVRSPDKFDVKFEKYTSAKGSTELMSDQFFDFFGEPPDLERLSNALTQRVDFLNAFPDTLIICVEVFSHQHQIHQKGDRNIDRIKYVLRKVAALVYQSNDRRVCSFSLHTFFPRSDEKKMQLVQKVDELLDVHLSGF